VAHKDIDEAIAREQGVEKLVELRSRLAAAARDNVELILTSDECLVLAHHIAVPLRPKGRPIDVGERDAAMSLYCSWLERAGQPVKVAVAATAEKFNCSIATVFAARKPHSK
jgi:hypothetical protein